MSIASPPTPTITWFFTIKGAEVEKYPGVAKRVFNEGHEIGNHTFTHPDISNISRGFSNGTIWPTL